MEYYRSGINIYNFGPNAPGWIPFYNGDLGNVIKLANNPKNRWTPAWYSGDPATEIQMPNFRVYLTGTTEIMNSFQRSGKRRIIHPPAGGEFEI